MTTYTIPADIDAWRSPSDEHGIQFTTAPWDEFKTTRETTFTDVDCIDTPKYDDAHHYYYFRLPPEALPYRTFIVWKYDAKVKK